MRTQAKQAKIKDLLPKKKNMKLQQEDDPEFVLLNSLSSIAEDHHAKKSEYFKQGKPFLTCVDSKNDLWTKEMPDGSVFMVRLNYDLKNR